jgi:hypothetical protein
VDLAYHGAALPPQGPIAPPAGAGWLVDCSLGVHGPIELWLQANVVNDGKHVTSTTKVGVYQVVLLTGLLINIFPCNHPR